MVLDFESDLDLMMSTDEFAVNVTVDSTPPVIAGIFDADYAEVDAGGMAMESSAPAIAVKSSDVAARSIVEGTAITTGGINYTVADVRSDGVAAGMTVLRLNRA